MVSMKPLDDILPHECRYPCKKAWVSGELQSRRVHMFCSKQCVTGSAYCQAHKVLCERQTPAKGVPLRLRNDNVAAEEKAVSEALRDVGEVNADA
jgi:hypothetical protein